ncbi:MAG: peptide chain release factor N(5)-glutamine methyltransferase [Actinomycetota bacterium]|nr:peptide chain release factor N(5)-glutamine methyltransferase [Actinomycetota bacterium]
MTVPTAPDGAARALVGEVRTLVGDRREATWIVEHAEAAGLGVQGARVLARRRAAGEPLQYVLGTWPFRTLELRVDRRALVPRPETEVVVGVALDELAVLGRPGRVAIDLGTGSGAIALSLAVEARGGTDLEVWATDRSAEALALAGENVARLAGTDPAAAARLRLVEGSWFAALPAALAGRCDLIVANPPYVAEDELPGLDPVVREWEPRSALVAGPGRSGVAGLADVEEVLTGAARWLAPGGAVVVELAPHQAAGAADVARRAGLAGVRTERDLAGRLRMVVAHR